MSTTNPLGNGVLAPLQRSGNSDFRSGSGEALLRNALMQLLLTESGELAWRPSFGAGLARFRNQNITTDLTHRIEAAVVSAVATFEPRVRVLSVQAEQVDTQLQVLVRWAAVLPGSTNTLIPAREPLEVVR